VTHSYEPPGVSVELSAFWPLFQAGCTETPHMLPTCIRLVMVWSLSSQEKEVKAAPDGSRPPIEAMMSVLKLPCRFGSSRFPSMKWNTLPFSFWVLLLCWKNGISHPHSPVVHSLWTTLLVLLLGFNALLRHVGVSSDQDSPWSAIKAYTSSGKMIIGTATEN